MIHQAFIINVKSYFLGGGGGGGKEKKIVQNVATPTMLHVQCVYTRLDKRQA